MVRYGETFKHVSKIVLSKPPNAKFKARDLVPLIERRVGYRVTSGRIGQCLSRLRQAGLVQHIPDGRRNYDWVRVGAIL